MYKARHGGQRWWCSWPPDWALEAGERNGDLEKKKRKEKKEKKKKRKKEIGCVSLLGSKLSPRPLWILNSFSIFEYILDDFSDPVCPDLRCRNCMQD